MSRRLDADSRFLMLPVETRSRELDAKLLLSLFAVDANFQVILSQKWLINPNLKKLPRGLFLFKTLNGIDATVMRPAQKLQYTIVAWDDEGPGQFRHANYLKGTVDDAVSMTNRIYAWGQNQLVALTNKYPQYPGKFLATGNPRWDLLRPEYRGFYEPDAQRLRERLGRFLLINTNFSFYNSMLGDLNALLNIQHQAGSLMRDNKEDMAKAQEIWSHEKSIVKSYMAVIPDLSAAFPDHTIVIRPHPVENAQRWHDLEDQFPSVKVIHEGSAIPWLMAADVVIQNGCTTGIETYTLGKPVISYCQSATPLTDCHLANRICPRAHDKDELISMIKDFTSPDSRTFQAAREKTWSDFSFHVSGLAGELASPAIISDLVQLSEQRENDGARFDRKLNIGEGLTPIKLPPLLARKFPTITKDEMMAKVRALAKLNDKFQDVEITELGESCFLIRRAGK